MRVLFRSARRRPRTRRARPNGDGDEGRAQATSRGHPGRPRAGATGPGPTGRWTPALASATDAEAADHVGIAPLVLALEVVQEPAALADQHQQATAGVEVLLVALHVPGPVVDALRQQRDLPLGGAGLALLGGEFLGVRGVC